MSPARDCDVVIVGGGLSGLCAARRLTDEGVSVTVLEARDRVGGRTFSVDHAGHTFDLGGQWIGPKQHRLHALAAELGVSTFPTFHRGKSVLETGGQVRRYRGDIPPVGILDLVGFQVAAWRLDRMRKTIPLDRPWEAAVDGGRTVAQVAESITRRPRVRALFDTAVRVVFGAEPDELGLWHFLFYLNSGGGLFSLVEVEDGAQQRRFTEGAQALAIRLAEQLPGRVVTGAPVRRIEAQENASDGPWVVAHTDIGRVSAQYAILAIPPPLSARIEFSPALPIARRALVERMPMGFTAKVLCFYDTPFWRDDGHAGEAVCTDGPASFVIDNSSPRGEVGCLLAFLVGGPGRRWRAQPEADRRQSVIDQLVRYFGPKAAHPEHVIEYDWADQEWTGGCPVASMGPSVMGQFGHALRTPVGPIHWAGTETASDWNGYLEGAVMAGRRAASEVLARL